MSGYVYILASRRNGTLYIGVTSNIEKRIREHKNGEIPGFTQKYNVKILVYYCGFENIEEAITYEKKIKGWTRKKKIALIEEYNSLWNNLDSSALPQNDNTFIG